MSRVCSLKPTATRPNPRNRQPVGCVERSEAHQWSPCQRSEAHQSKSRPGPACRGVDLVQPAMAGAPGQGPRATGPRNGSEGRGVGRRRQCGDHGSRGRAGPRVCTARPALRVGGMDEGDGPELGTGVQSSASRPSARRGLDHVQGRHSTLRSGRSRVFVAWFVDQRGRHHPNLCTLPYFLGLRRDIAVARMA